MCVYKHIYIYICIAREREIHIYIYIYTHIHIQREREREGETIHTRARALHSYAERHMVAKDIEWNWNRESAPKGDRAPTCSC